MPPGTQPITGTNSQFTQEQRSPLPDFLARQFNTPKLQIGKADLSAVDPQYRNIYRQFNQSIGALEGQRDAAMQQANLSRDVLANQYTRGAQSAEQERIRNSGLARQTAGEAQAQARQRIRAIGGAPSSAALELSNRIDRDTLQHLGNIGERYSTRLGELENTALSGLSDIEGRLQGAIQDILANATMTLREKDAAIRAAQEAAARSGGSGGGSGGGYDPYAGLINALYGNQRQGSVLGANTQELPQELPQEDVAINRFSSQAAELRNDPIATFFGGLGFAGGVRSGQDAQAVKNLSAEYADRVGRRFGYVATNPALVADYQQAINRGRASSHMGVATYNKLINAGAAAGPLPY